MRALMFVRNWNDAFGSVVSWEPHHTTSQLSRSRVQPYLGFLLPPTHHVYKIKDIGKIFDLCSFSYLIPLWTPTERQHGRVIGSSTLKAKRVPSRRLFAPHSITVMYSNLHIWHNARVTRVANVRVNQDLLTCTRPDQGGQLYTWPQKVFPDPAICRCRAATCEDKIRSLSPHNERMFTEIWGCILCVLFYSIYKFQINPASWNVLRAWSRFRLILMTG